MTGICATPAAITDSLDAVLRRTTIFRWIAATDRQRLAAAGTVRAFDRDVHLFREGDDSDRLYTILSGRVKEFKTTARGTDLILEIFGPGESVGAVAVYQSRPYPASAVALEPATCLLIPRQAFFSLLEHSPSMVRGLLTGLTHSLDELTDRVADLSTGHVDARLARLFLKLAGTMGQQTREGTFIPLALSRQELADMIGTTIETSIRTMSRWGKQGLVHTDKGGFLITDRAALKTIGGL